MKKIIFIAMATAALGVFAACGKTGDLQEESLGGTTGQETVTDNEMQSVDEKVITATVDEVKDFMITVKDAEGNFYTVSFERIVEGQKSAADFAIGDVVRITYTGEATEVDGFTGDILSVERVDLPVQ